MIMSSGNRVPTTVAEVDVYAAETIENWYPTYDLLRNEAPVYHVPGTKTYFLTRYDDIHHVLRNTDIFLRGSGEAKPLLKDAEARDYYAKHGYPKKLPLAVNPPEHRCFRDLVDHFFSVTGAETRAPLIESICHRLIDQWIDDGEVDFMDAFAVPLPVEVITTIMGLPLSDVPQLKIWSEAWVAPFSGQLTAAEERDVARKSVDFQHYLAGKIQEKRANPDESVLSYVTHTEVQLPDETRPLTDGEIINIIDHLYIGGNETTTFALTSGMWLLVQNPDIQDELRHDPDKLRLWVNEVLRLESPTQGMDRHTSADTEINGVAIPQGSHIHIRYAAANRDPAQYSCPADIDLTRDNGHRHLAFSIGESHCPGAGLSRLEQRIATGILLDRLENIRFTENRNSFQHEVNFTLRAFSGLHLTFDKR